MLHSHGDDRGSSSSNCIVVVVLVVVEWWQQQQKQQHFYSNRFWKERQLHAFRVTQSVQSPSITIKRLSNKYGRIIWIKLHSNFTWTNKPDILIKCNVWSAWKYINHCNISNTKCQNWTQNDMHKEKCSFTFLWSNQKFVRYKQFGSDVTPYLLQ